MAVIIFGASGFLGGKLMEYCAKTNKKAIGTYANNKKDGLVKFDFENPDLKSLNLSLKDFSHVVICSSITIMDSCKIDNERTYRINVTGTKQLISQLFEAGIIPIFISTDYVFDGSKGNYSEQEERKPVLVYGRHKKEVEDYLTDSKNKYLIVRLAKLYDISGDDQGISNLINDLNSGSKLTMAVDQIFSPTYVWDVCKAIMLLIDKKITGCYNVCSGEAISRYEFAGIVKEKLRIEKGNIVPCSIKDLKFEDNRPLNTSMNNKKFTELTGFKFITFREVLGKIKK